MAAVMMNPNAQHPHRKPVPRSFNNVEPQRHPSPAIYASRDSSNSPPISGPSQYPATYQPTNGRTLSNATSNDGMSGLNRMSTNSTMPRRSTSSRSNGSSGSPTSYVALMRKQKATVWCDRAQEVDPRALAQHRANKVRAAMAVAGGKQYGNRTSTSSSNQGGTIGLRSKIRHQGAPKAGTYTGGANMSGAGVPIRLSALDDAEEQEDLNTKYAQYNQRNGSGRSSLGSGPRSSSNFNGPSRSNESTPPSGHSPRGSMSNVPEEPTQASTSQHEYLDNEDSAEAEEQFGGIGRLPPSKPKTERDFKLEEELRRRGSVDDRAMTMSGQRLFVANPDLSD